MALSGSSAAAATAKQPPMLCAQGLSVRYRTPSGWLPALEGANCEIRRGEIVGVLGESGSGKSTLARSLLGLLPESAEVSGSLFLGEQSMLLFRERDWATIRGRSVAMVFQEPGLALSPFLTCGRQIMEILRAHRASFAKPAVHRILEDVGFQDPERIFNAYPHQLSGGEKQRICIAQAIACEPELIVADEATRSLDVRLQAEIIGVLREANRKFGCAILFISHNPAILAGFANRVIVMYGGHVVEEGPVLRVFQRPLHPYTKALLQLVPSSLGSTGDRVPAIPGNLSSDAYGKPGCIFAGRCVARTEICDTEFPPEVTAEADHRVSCFNYEI